MAWPDLRVAVEVEGGVWSKTPGRHTRGAGFEADCEKYNAAAAAGWRVARVTTKMISDGRAHDQVLSVLRGAGCEVKSIGRIRFG